MPREYRMREEPNGTITVTEGQLNREGRWIYGLWSVSAANFFSALKLIERHELVNEGAELATR